jgi:hypothetical protein
MSPADEREFCGHSGRVWSPDEEEPIVGAGARSFASLLRDYLGADRSRQSPIELRLGSGLAERTSRPRPCASVR